MKSQNVDVISKWCRFLRAKPRALTATILLDLHALFLLVLAYCNPLVSRGWLSDLYIKSCNEMPVAPPMDYDEYMEHTIPSSSFGLPYPCDEPDVLRLIQASEIVTTLLLGTLVIIHVLGINDEFGETDMVRSNQWFAIVVIAATGAWIENIRQMSNSVSKYMPCDPWIDSTTINLLWTAVGITLIGIYSRACLIRYTEKKTRHDSMAGAGAYHQITEDDTGDPWTSDSDDENEEPILRSTGKVVFGTYKPRDANT